MKVRAKNDDIRKVIVHPSAGAFREDGSAEWPDDSFTAKRLADGDITTEVETHSPPDTSQPAPPLSDVPSPDAPPPMKKLKKE